VIMIRGWDLLLDLWGHESLGVQDWSFFVFEIFLEQGEVLFDDLNLIVLPVECFLSKPRCTNISIIPE
jgi:hypothetical protein